MSPETKEKVLRLPAWARELIQDLEVRAQPNLEEIIRLHRDIEHMKKVRRRQDVRMEAMIEMFQCSAKGGNEVALAVQRIVEDWGTDPGSE